MVVYSEKTRTVLYLTICVPIRLVLAYMPIYLADTHRPYLATLTGAMSLGMLCLALGNDPSTQTGFFGGHAWWAPYRVVHGMILLLATVLLLRRDKNASVLLLVDVLVGLVIYAYVIVNR